MPTQSPKSKLVSKILDAAGKKGTARTKLRAKMMKLTVPKLKAIAKKSGVGTSSRRSSAKKKTTTRRTPTRRTPTRRTASKKKTAASASSSASKLSNAAKSRVAKLVRGIKAGKISAKRGKKSPADYATGTAKSRYAKFIKLYKGVRVPKGTSTSKSTSIKAQYASIKSRSKKPYYLSRGYRVKGYVVGGGARGEGLIRPVPGTRAKSFHKLTKAQQKAVVKFLNTGAGKTLRGKRAPATAQLGKLLRQAARQKAAS